VPAALR